ncbi:MAG: MFS transporter [Bacteroidetes bacterium]|nr:MFS transporter [Bacteroidota bacterium]
MFSEHLTYQEKKRYMRFAIYSSCFGAVIQRTLSESSVFIVYASALGAGKFLSLVTTALIPCMTLIFLVPVAYIMEHKGIKRVLIPVYSGGFIGLLFAVTAGSLPNGKLKTFFFYFGILLYSASIGIHAAGWFPLQRHIVPRKERGNYFGKMRYSWQTAVGIFLLGSSLIIWKSATTIKLQLIILIGALLSLGRLYYTTKIPERPLEKHIPPLKIKFLAAVHDKNLIKYSLYGFLLNLLICSTVPMGFGFVKYELGLPQHLTILLSVFVNISAITGYLVGSRLIDKNHSGKLFLVVQIIFALINFLFLFCYQQSSFSLVFSTILTCLAGALFAFSSVVASAKMFGMVKESNINISLAVCFGLYNGGKGISRLISSFMVGILPESFSLFGITWSSFHLLFTATGIVLVITTGIMVIRKSMTNQFWN